MRRIGRFRSISVIAMALAGGGIAVTASAFFPLPPGAHRNLSPWVWTVVFVLGAGIGVAAWIGLEAVYDAISRRVGVSEIQRRQDRRRLGFDGDRRVE